MKKERESIDDEKRMTDKVRAITERGNDAEVRRDRDGNYKVYEIKKVIA